MGKKISIAIICISLVVAFAAFFIDIKLECNAKDIVVEAGEGSSRLLDLPFFYIKGNVFFYNPVKVNKKINVEPDFNKVGEYDCVISTSFLCLHREAEFKVTVIDTTAPQINLVEAKGSYTLPGCEYVEEGFVAFDNCDGNITDRVVVTKDCDKVIYTVSDSSGNETSAVRTINYDDPIAPEIIFENGNEIDIEQYKKAERYLYDYAAFDNLDGDITSSVTIEGEVDTQICGDYEVVYKVKDSYNNETNVTRLIHVIKRAKTPACEIEATNKVIYLTFDDGPSGYTPGLLDVLDKYDVKATFFVVHNEKMNIIKDIYERGHTVGLHSYSHNYNNEDSIYLSEEAYFDDLYKLQDEVYDLIGERVYIIRFPGGSSLHAGKYVATGIQSLLTQKVEELGFSYFDWNVSTGDGTSYNPPLTDTESVYGNAISGISGKSTCIVLQHDIKKWSIDAVSDIIEWGQSNGYVFLPLDDTSYGAHHGLRN